MPPGAASAAHEADIGDAHTADHRDLFICQPADLDFAGDDASGEPGSITFA
jgi:hypothetical protein